MADGAALRIDHYRVLEKIGSGGMGEVYRAIDERLGRAVALKLLPQADAAQTRRQVRLVREAQAAGHLNHPGIVTVHDVGHHGDRSYVVMELVDGTSLRELCGRIGAAEAVSLCAQAAEALAVAHARGILHRDIKPDNLMVTGDGRLKILDFGLAKLRGDEALPAFPARSPAPAADAPTVTASGSGIGPATPAAPTVTASSDGIASTITASLAPAAGSPPVSPSLTLPGQLLGTPAYMAPEQAARAGFDERSEVYSLGLVLYELVSGRRPLERESFDETLAAALAADVPPLARAGSRRAHRALARVLARALARDPADRFATMAEMAAALRVAEARLSPRDRLRRTAALSLLAVALAGGGLVGLRSLRGGGEPGEPVVEIRGNRRLTFDPGCESAPSFTPDGRALLVSAAVDGDMEIIRLELADGRRRRLTTLPGWDLGAVASPDGRRIAFVHFGDRGRELHLTGGGPPRVIHRVSGDPGWAAGGHLLYGDDAGRVLRLDPATAGAAPVELARLPDRMVVAEVGGFPDGAVAFLARAPGPEQSLFHVGVIDAGGRVRLLDRAPAAAAGAGLAIDRAGRGLYHAVRTPGGVEQLVWRDRTGGRPVPLPGLPVSSSGMDTDGGRMVLSTCREHRIGARLRAGGSLEPLEDRRELAMSNLTAAGDRAVVFASDRSGRPQIWLLEPGQAPRVAVEEDSDQPAASRTHLAWVGRAAGRPGVHARPLAGGPVVRLTDGAQDVQPLFSHDGQTVYFLRVGGEEAGRGWAVPLAGGPARPVTPPRVAELAVSPAEDRLAFIPMDRERPAVMVGPAGGPFTAVELPAGTYWSPWFSRDGRRLLVVRGATEVLEVPVAGGPARPIWSGGTSAVWHIEEAPDGDGWLAALAVFEGDLILLDGRFR